MILQIIRRSVQGLTVLLVVALALLSLYAHYRAARVIDDATLIQGMRWSETAKAIHEVVGRLDDPQAVLDGNKGSVWSMRLFGFSMSDPLAAVEMAAASKHVHWPLIVSAILPVALTLLLGKVFCSWICPGYLLFELCGKLRRLLKLAEIQPGEVRFAHANKYAFLVVGIAAATVVSAPFFALVYPPAVVSRAIHAWIFGTELMGLLTILGVIVAFEVLVSPRWWCQTVCPGGALYGVLGVLRPVQVRLERSACTGCKECIPVCEAGINPITRSTSIECDNCGVCIRHCEPAALKFRVGLPAPLVRWRKRRKKAAERAASAALATLIALLPVRAIEAHHILGLPHYSYKENYPQRPTLEYPATTGPFDVLFTSLPGIPVPGEAANLAFYIKNRQTGGVLGETVTVRILKTSTFGDNTTVREPTVIAPFDNQHKLHAVFPEDGEYIVELSMPVEGRTEVIPFLFVAGNPSSAGSWFAVGAIALVAVFILVRAVQVKRRRRSRGEFSVAVPA